MADPETPRILFQIPLKKPTDPVRLANAGRRISVGATAGCALALDDPLVTEVHCSMELQGESFYLVDEDSPTGTYHNGIPVDSRVELSRGDEIVLGCSRIRILSTEDGNGPQLSLSLEERGFHFVEKGKGGKLPDLYQWACSEVAFGRSKTLAWLNAGSVLIGIVTVAFLFWAPVRESLAQPGGLHETHARLFDEPEAWRRDFPEQVRIAQENGCAACHAPFGNTPLERCAECHRDLMANQHPFKDAPFALAAGFAGNWGDLACLQCHVDHPRGTAWDIVPSLQETPESCGSCHAETYQTHRELAKVELNRRPAIDYDGFRHDTHLAEPSPIPCNICHIPAAHNESSVASTADQDFEDAKFETCMRCHSADEVTRDPDLEDHWPGDPSRFRVTWHGTEDGGTHCLRCHERLHDAQLARDSRSVALDVQFKIETRFGHESFFQGHPEYRDRPGVSSCEECHFDSIKSESEDSAFWHGLHMVSLVPGQTSGERSSTAIDLSLDSEEGCTSCHVGIAGASELAGGSWRDTEGRCDECHGQEALFVASQRTESRTTPRFPHDVHVAAFGVNGALQDGCFACHEFVGDPPYQAVGTKASVVENCTDCHEGHAAVGGGDCQACHDAADGVWRDDVPPWESWPALNPFDHHSVGHEAVACDECHSGTELASRVRDIPIPSESDAACRDCHLGQGKRFHWR